MQNLFTLNAPNFLERKVMSAKSEIEDVQRNISDALSALRNVRSVDEQDQFYLNSAKQHLDSATRELEDALRHVKQLMRDANE
jgi:predicted  nucleic acid-binding Zn-ribbon protein